MDLRHVRRVKKLYKTILRLHMRLPSELQELGTKYAKDEFKRHKKCNYIEANTFIAEWSEYAMTLSGNIGIKDSSIGSIPETSLDQFRDDQIQQLYELMQASNLQKK